jgi:hypothetical protein
MKYGHPLSRSIWILITGLAIKATEILKYNSYSLRDNYKLDQHWCEHAS